MREEPNWDAPRQCMVSQLSAYSKSSFTAPEQVVVGQRQTSGSNFTAEELAHAL